MTKYIALLRGINVGGNNKISMKELKAAYERYGFSNVSTYINSGNVIFESDITDNIKLKAMCEKMIAQEFKLNILTAVISAEELIDSLNHKPSWWNVDTGSKHNAFFVIPPAVAEDLCATVGQLNPQYERAECYANVIFWSAPIETFSKTRWSKAVSTSYVRDAITVRNANTTIKLAQLVADLN